ncbi:hypothetical protein AB4Y63_17100 [Leifsonia sp. YAF41]|uniref:hypothetical protein n=1 Tax=Leifsonia sp. YAF41 TaxID=3233086 RepID=UPI003F944A9A
MQTLTDQPLPDQLRDAASAAPQVGDGAAGYAALSDAELLESQTQLGSSWMMTCWMITWCGT